MIKLEIYHHKTFIKKYDTIKDIDSIRDLLKIWLQNFMPDEFGRMYTLEKLLDEGEQSFPTGYVNYLKKELEKKEIKVELDDKRTYPEYLKKYNLLEDLPTLYPTQAEALDGIKLNPFGVIAKATGSGKSRLILETVLYRQGKVLVVVPNKTIQNQMYEMFCNAVGKRNVGVKAPKKNIDHLFEIEDEVEVEQEKSSDPLTKLANLYSGDSDYQEGKKEGLNLGNLYSKKHTEGDEEKEFFKQRKVRKDIRKGNSIEKAQNKEKRKVEKSINNITILCYQSLGTTSEYYLNQVETIIVDECHHSSSKSIRNALLLMPNATYRYFFSATPWRDRKGEHKLLISAIGDNLIYELRGKEAVEKGIIAAPILQIVEPPAPKNPDGVTYIRKLRNHREIVERGIIYNITRNACIIDEAMKLFENNKNVFIAVNEVAHLELLEKKFLKMTDKIQVIHGDVPALEKQKREKRLAENTDGLITIGTMAVGQGGNYPNINAVIIASGGKSSIQFLQRIGRGSRKTKDSFIVIDFKDWYHKRLLKHYRERVRYYEEEFEMDIPITLGEI